MNDFEAQIRAFELKALRQANKSVSNKIESLFTDVVVLTPSPANPGDYAQGHLVDQWYPQLNSFSSEISSVTNPNGANSLSRIKAMLSGLAFFGKDNVITLTNNVDYAYRAEVLGWPSGQGANGWIWSGRVGPYAMVRTAVNNWKGASI